MLLAVMTACGPKNKVEMPVAPEAVEASATDAVERMRAYHYEDTLTWRGQKYAYAVVREADDSLEVVTDEDGMRYADNYICLELARAGLPVFKKRFTKSTFAGLLDENFREDAILDGVAFAHTAPNGICFSFSVSYPGSDLCMPFLVTVDGNGDYTIKPDDVLDTQLEDKTVDPT